MFALMTLLCCWLGYQLNWIRERRDARSRPDLMFLLGDPAYAPLRNAGVRKAPAPLTWLGESGVNSPTRAALITGRNHHTVRFGTILNENGYATSCFGKNQPI